MSIEPWNNGVGAPLCRESLLTKGSRIILFDRKGAAAPFPASGEDRSGQRPKPPEGLQSFHSTNHLYSFLGLT